MMLLGAAGLLLWFSLRCDGKDTKTADQCCQIIDRWRQERNRRAEAVMVEALQELGWPQAAKKMTEQEVAHQICTRLAEKLWNRPGVD